VRSVSPRSGLPSVVVCLPETRCRGVSTDRKQWRVFCPDACKQRELRSALGPAGAAGAMPCPVSSDGAPPPSHNKPASKPRCPLHALRCNLFLVQARAHPGRPVEGTRSVLPMPWGRPDSGLRMYNFCDIIAGAVATSSSSWPASRVSFRAHQQLAASSQPGAPSLASSG
jgi:hypothetical protein